MSYYRHSQAIVESNAIGDGTRIWAFCHVLPGAVIGKECNLCDQTFIENDVVIGDGVTVKCGVQIWDGIRIEDGAFIGPNATFSNDRFPRSGIHLDKYPITTIRYGASIGANATILPGITIGQHAMVGAGAVVTRSVPPYAVVVGNPARIVRYVSSQGPDSQTQPDAPSGSAVLSSCVEGVTLSRRPIIRDMRGNLSAREQDDGIPFVIKRYFIITDVPSKDVRGEHAHKRCKQLLVCLQGSVQVVADDGTHRQEFVLDSPELALYLPPMVWGIQYRYAPETVLMVLASELYDPADYIRDYDEFLREKCMM
jgi:UDP-2-acetamido-3-amino-2,3-dideoxy-glucuronate N-acetyltransferase